MICRTILLSIALLCFVYTQNIKKNVSELLFTLTKRNILLESQFIILGD